MDHNSWILDTLEQLKTGAFLMVQDNPMTIGWAQFGITFGKLCASVYVRDSRHTHALLKDATTFTISVPFPGEMKSELSICGTKSGRDCNKLELIKKGTFPARFECQNGLEGCRYQIECKIVQRIELNTASFESDAILDRFYRSGDPHTMYIGEILGVTEVDHA